MNGVGIKLEPHHTLDELKNFRNKSKKSNEIMHTNVIILMLSDGISSFEASRRLSISPETARNVLIRFNENGIDGLKDKRKSNKRGDTFVTEELLKDIDKHLSKECVYGGLWSGKKLQRWVEENYDKQVVISTIYRWLHTLNYSTKIPRPKHKKSSFEEKEKFKKNNI